MKTKLLSVFLLVLLVFLVTSCMPGGDSNSEADPAGFFMGIWHGWIAPISVIIGFFNDNIRLYEIHNTGWWYDFGFYMAILGGFGGFSLARSKSKRQD